MASRRFTIDARVEMSISSELLNSNLPRPLRPTKRKSLNFATWFFITAVQFRSSPQKFSSLPAITVTRVPSHTSPNATTLNAMGRVLLDRQCVGRVVQTWGNIQMWRNASVWRSTFLRYAVIRCAPTPQDAPPVDFLGFARPVSPLSAGCCYSNCCFCCHYWNSYDSHLIYCYSLLGHPLLMPDSWWMSPQLPNA